MFKHFKWIGICLVISFVSYQLVGVVGKSLENIVMGGMFIPLIVALLIGIHGIEAKNKSPEVVAEKKRKLAEKERIRSEKVMSKKITCPDCGWRGTYQRFFDNGHLCPRCRNGTFNEGWG